MNVTKLPSGSYRIRKTIEGKRVSITFDHKPTQKEVENKVFEIRKAMPNAEISDSFAKCARYYIDSKSNVLSPSTIRSYESIMRNISDAFLAARLDHITALMIQREINTYAKTRSPKSVKNFSGFITTVMWTYRPDMQIKSKLPQSVKKETYIPSDEDAKKVIEAIKGSEYEAVILLCLLGLRKSEAICITADDIKKDKKDYVLTINKAKVADKDGNYVIKTTKSVAGTRTIFLPPYLAELILGQGNAYTMYPGNILRCLHRVQDSLGLPRTKLHALRHYYISHAHEVGIPDATIAKSVGHKNISTTQNIYTHAIETKQMAYEKKASIF